MTPSAAPSAQQARKLRILGVDPSVAGRTGYGVIEVEGSTARPMRFGALRFPDKLTFAVRLREIHFLISGLVEQFSPDAVAVESVFAALNIRTALKLAEMRGVVLLAAAQAQIPAHSYSPREVKASVAGFGGASKQQIQQMVRSLLGLQDVPQHDDVTDALAVALCHAQALRVRERMALQSRSSLAVGAAARPRAAAASISSRGR